MYRPAATATILSMKPPHTAERLPRTRRQVIDYFAEASRSHSIKGLFELDLTALRRMLRRRRREGNKPISLSVYLLYAYARALEAHRELQAHIRRGRKLIIFEDIDVSTIVERRVGDRRVPTSYIVRRANRKSIEEIQNELDAAATEASTSLVTAGGGRLNPATLLGLLPGLFRRLILREILRRNPFLKKRLFGTVSFSAMQMFGGGFGYGIPITPHPVHLLIGGIEKREVLINGEPTTKEVAGITLTLDHDVADGAPAARFVARFKGIVEKGEIPD